MHETRNRDLFNSHTRPSSLAPGAAIFSRVCPYITARKTLLLCFRPIDAGKFRGCIRQHLFSTEKLQFLKRLIILVFHLMSLSVAVYFRPADMDAALLQWPEEITDIFRTVAECFTVLGVVNYILVQLGGEMINVGPLSFLKQLVGSNIFLPAVVIGRNVLARSLAETFNLKNREYRERGMKY